MHQSTRQVSSTSNEVRLAGMQVKEAGEEAEDDSSRETYHAATLSETSSSKTRQD